MCAVVQVPVQQSASFAQWWPAGWHAHVVPLQTMYPQHVPFVSVSHGSPAAMQQRFAKVEPVSYVPNAVSTVAQEIPAVGVAQHGLAAPGVHAALLARVHELVDMQVPVSHVPVPQEVPHDPQFAGSVRRSTQVLLAEQ